MTFLSSNLACHSPVSQRVRHEGLAVHLGVADEITDPDSKRKMLRIADDYEKLAGRAEKRLAAKNPK
jgi:hypothetical protein